MSKKTKKEGWIVPGGEKLAMVFGAGATQTMNTFVQTFLSLYILMVGISPSVAAVVLLILKGWDAINDMVFGFMVDKYRFKPGKNKFTKWLFSGRYMPWFRVLFMTIPIGTVILFTINTGMPMWVRVAQYCLGYFLYDFGMTVTGAYGLLPLSVTNNFDERNFILSWNGLGQGFGSLPVIFLGTVMIAGSTGYAGAAVIFSLLGMVLAIIPAIFVKERNTTVINPEAQEKYTIKEMLKTLKQMPELILLLIGVLLWGIFYTGGYGLFVSYYIFDDANLSIILTLLAVIPTIILVPLLPVIFKKVDKIVVARITCSVFAIAGILICVLGADFLKANIGMLYLLSALQGMSYSLTMFACSQLTPDLAEMARFRTGQDVGGIVAAAYNFVAKLVGSLVSSVTLLILGIYGFVSVEANSFDELAAMNARGEGLQTARALEGLWNVSYLFPLIGFGAAAVVFFFVKIKREDIKVYMEVNSGQISRSEGEELLQKTKVKTEDRGKA
jgi:Na+/melibiose symporter and related transporters